MNLSWILGVVAVVVVLMPVISYNRFVDQQNLIRNSWSNIDTELRRRYDLIPNLVETVRGYAAHEREVLLRVTQARATAEASNGSPAEQARSESPLVVALRELFAVSEGYPQLTASGNFLALQEELVHTEDRLQAARRFFNANVADYNRRVRSVPSNIIAGIFGFEESEYFQIEPAVRQAADRGPTVDLS